MISRLTDSLVFQTAEAAHLRSLTPHAKEMWDKPPDEEIKGIKLRIRDYLLINQDYVCGYCGLDLGGTSDGQIEHIAPKAQYPQFTFEKGNLVMACHYCNGFSKKGNYDTVLSLDVVYNKCAFKLVHPYFDDPSIHYEWLANDKKVIIKGISDKGLYSIGIFKLDDTKMTELRGKKVIADIVISNSVTPQIDDILIQSIINYK